MKMKIYDHQNNFFFQNQQIFDLFLNKTMIMKITSYLTLKYAIEFKKHDKQPGR